MRSPPTYLPEGCQMGALWSRNPIPRATTRNCVKPVQQTAASEGAARAPVMQLRREQWVPDVLATGRQT